MSLFDGILSEVQRRLGLEEEARRLLNGLLKHITEGQDGLAGFLSQLQHAGLGDRVMTWIGSGANATLSGSQVEHALGTTTLDKLAHQAGTSRGTAASAYGLMIPAVVDRLTPGGVVPNPRNLMSALGDHVAGAMGGVPSTGGAVTSGFAPTARDMWNGAPQAGSRRPGLSAWGLAVLFLAIALLGWWLRSHAAVSGESGAHGTAPAPAVVAAAAPASGSPTIDPSLTVLHQNGKVGVSGSVPDEATRDRILAALTTAFGPGSVRGDLMVDAAVKSPSWLNELPAAFAALAQPGAELSLDGNLVSVGGSLSTTDRDALIARLKTIFGETARVGTFAEAAAVASSATDRASAALEALGTSFSSDDLVGALNLSIINFASGSAVIPPDSQALLDKGAAALKRAPARTLIEVGGHTDSTGNAAANVRLSRARAEAVRSALIDRGVSPDRVVAKGYGGHRPVASNDTESGRLRNRRVDVHETQVGPRGDVVASFP